VLYADVTAGSREAANDQSLIAGDGLHPSEKEYRKWAEKTVELIALQLK
jgi:lysophospholipase L1-like esterase